MPNGTMPNGTTSYEPYVHVSTGERVAIAVGVDPATGVRYPIVPVPAFFVHAPSATYSSGSGNGFLASVIRLVTCTTSSEPSVGVMPPSVSPSVLQSPSGVRRLDFAGADDQHGDDSTVPNGTTSQRTLATKTLEKLNTKLELQDIAGWLVQFKTAVGRVDTDALALLSDPDWRGLLATSAPWAINANVRIATALEACFDSDGANVVLLESKLRDASETDHPGILFSGMDMLEEVRALVTDRSLGEIKLNSKATTLIVFKAGATIDDTRLVAETIKKRFGLKTDSERAIPNALLHEIISKIPDSTDPKLQHQKETYENDLFKTEMNGDPPPCGPSRS